MKRLIALLLCVLMLVGMCACSKDNSSSDTTTASDEVKAWGEAVKAKSDGKTITVAMASHPSTEAFQTMVDDFTALTGITVKWDIVEETNLKNKQLLDQGSGAYDVLMVDAFWMTEYASKNVLVPLADYLADETRTPAWFDYEDIMPAYRDGISSVEGTIYAIPSSGETRFVAYRTDLFEKYDKQPPETMDDFLALAQFFNNECDDVEYGVAMRAQRGIHFASGWMSLMYNFGGGFLDQSTLDSDNVVVTCTDPATVESLQYFVDLMKCAPPDVGTYTHEEALGAFISGKTAMWLDATALADQITDPETSTVADKVAFVATPTGSDGDGAALAGWSLGISSASKNSDEAWAFIVYMASRENSVRYVTAGGGATRASIFENEELVAAHPSYPAQLVALEAANGLVQKGLSWIPQHAQSNSLLEIAGNYGSAALAGEIAVEEACTSMQADIEDLLASS